MRGVDVRRAIGLLQVYPLVVSIASIVVTAFDLSGKDIADIVAPFFGVSLFAILCPYCMARAVGVSSWSKALYATLGFSYVFSAACEFVFTGITDFAAAEVTMLILLTGIVSSFVTYLYDRYRSGI